MFITTFTYSQNNLDNKKIGDTIFYNKYLRHVSKDSVKKYGVIKNIQLLNNKRKYSLDLYVKEKCDSIYKFYLTQKTNTNRLEIVSPLGTTTFYHKNGLKSSHGEMKKGRAIGPWIYWYDNGNQKMERLFFKHKALKKIKPSDLINFWDENGIQTVFKGNGSYIYVTKKDSTMHKGNVKSGQKDGVWIGRYKNETKYYDENYDEGKLISGESWDKKGNHYIYTKEFEQPQFKKGMQGVKNIIKKNFKIPKIAIKNKIYGTILISFNVNINGDIDDVIVYRKVHPEVDIEAIRVIKLMKGWKPATRRGKKVKSRFTIPITYKVE